jgi:hypothetical protein
MHGMNFPDPRTSVSANDQRPTLPRLGHLEDLVGHIRAVNGRRKACADFVWGQSTLDEDAPSFVKRRLGLTLRRFNPPCLVLPKFAAETLF